MSMLDLLASLAGLELLEQASPEQLETLAARLRLHEFTAGEVIMRQHEPGGKFVLLLAGAVHVDRDRDEGTIPIGAGGPGGIFGEMSTITGEPRRATVIATTAVTAAEGAVDALDALVAIPGVMARLVDLATQRLAEIADPVSTRIGDGTDVVLRPLLARDRERFAASLASQSDEWRHLRFFTAVEPSPALVEYLVHVDYYGHFAWAVATPEPPSSIGTARFIRTRQDATVAELAFEVEDGWKGRGVGTLLLGALGAAADRLGIVTFRAEVLYENRSMRAVMNKAGAQWTHAETGVMATAFTVAGTRPLVSESAWSQLGAVAEQVAEISGLALFRGAAA